MQPKDIKCSEIGSLEYRRLCQAISLPQSDKKLSKTFTGIKDQDIIILKLLSDKDLINVCAVNKYLNTLCQDDNFWMNRTVDRYGEYLGKGFEIKDKYISDGTSWKDYYLWLSGLLTGNKTLASKIAIENNRKDLSILLNISDKDGQYLITQYVVTNNMRNFLNEADLGPSDPSNPWSLALIKVLSVGKNGVTNDTIINRLFEIYVCVNNMWKDSFFLTATPQMEKYFKNTFDRLAADPSYFRYSEIIPEIIMDNIDHNKKHSPILYDPVNKQRLQYELDLVKNIIYCNDIINDKNKYNK